MSLDQFVIRLERCHRCGWKALEILETHMFCANCNYSDELAVERQTEAPIPEWALKALESENLEVLL